MPARFSLIALTASAALALAACDGAGTLEAEGAGDPAASDTSATATTAGTATSADPTVPVSNTATPAATAGKADDVDSNPPGDECGASRVAAFVSQEATPAVRARLAAKVGHSRIRWVGPDTVVTMDYSAARLNVALDKDDVITGGRCG